MFRPSSRDSRLSYEAWTGAAWPATCGVAGSRGPELDAIFVCEGMEDAQSFVDMAREPTDIWAVDCDGLWAETGPDGGWIIPLPGPSPDGGCRRRRSFPDGRTWAER
jgi:hypothetical protein